MRIDEQQMTGFRGTQAAGLTQLGAEVARLARVATALHMAEVAQIRDGPGAPAAQVVRDQASRLRAMVEGGDR